MSADSQVLKRLDFPAYCIKLLDNGLVAIAGGGGTSKTGVSNWIEIGHINYLATSNDNSNFHAEFKLIAKLETVDAIMKFVSFSSPASGDLYLAAAVDHVVDIYKIQPVIKTVAAAATTNECNNHSNHANGAYSTRQRKHSTSKPVQNGSINKDTNSPAQLEASAELKLVNQIQLRDNNNNEENKKRKTSTSSNSNKQSATIDESIVSLQVCKYENATMLCAGTSTGSILVWNLEFETNNNQTNKINVVRLHEFEQAHGNSEIDDLQINKDGQLLSIGKDNKVSVWSLRSMTKLCDLNYMRHVPSSKGSNLRMKHARFSRDAVYLYTTYIPRVRQSSRHLCSYIQRWRRSALPDSATLAFEYKPERCYKLPYTIITSIQSSRDGQFVSVGDCDGNVYLLDAHFRQVKNFRRQHTSVITDLIFYHDCELASADLNKLLVSISIDRTIQLYKFINTSHHMLISSTSTSPSHSLSSSLLSCCLSMKLFQFCFLILVLSLLFCYFFTYIE